MSVSQSRRQFSSLISAAQQTPQVITKHNAPVAVLVSVDYFMQGKLAIKPATESFYSVLTGLSEAHPPVDNSGIGIKPPRGRQSKQPSESARDNAFVQSA